MNFGNCLYESIADKYYKDKSLYKDIKRKLFEGYAKLDYKTKNKILTKLKLRNDKDFYDRFKPDGSHGSDFTCIIIARELNLAIVVHDIEDKKYNIYYKDKDPIELTQVPENLLYILIKYSNHHYY